MIVTRRNLLQAIGATGALSALPVLAAPARGTDAAWPSERETGVFRCHADFSLDDYGDLLEEVGQLQDDLAKELEVAAPREVVHLFLFDRKATYLAYLQQYFPKVPARKALYIKGRGPGMVFAYRSAELPVDVRHESTHAVLHASIDNIPLWLDEGLAEYFEVTPAERAAKNPYVSAVRWNVRLGTVPDLAALERLRELGEMGRNEYRDAWAWVHFLLHGGDEPRAALRGYLAQLAAGEDPGPFADQLRRRVREPEAQYALHFRRWNVT
jgi:hypothetical protein